MSGRLLGPHGGYRDLKAYQLTEIIYDGTVSFAKISLDKRSRTIDQMVQAARSGKQNIAEAGRASATSKKTEMKLINVARASLEELLLDYEDFLRQRGYELWPKGHEKAVFIRKLRHSSGGNLSNRSDQTDLTDRIPTTAYDTYRKYVEEKGPENAANTLITLIHQANFLLDRLLRQLEQEFIDKGGFTETLYRARKQARDAASNSD